jgi:hypothetical protein
MDSFLHQFFSFVFLVYTILEKLTFISVRSEGFSPRISHFAPSVKGSQAQGEGSLGEVSPDLLVWAVKEEKREKGKQRRKDKHSLAVSNES